MQSGGGFLTLYPSDATKPTVANSNYAANEVLNNAFTVGLGATDGAFNIFVTSNTNVIVDITGYYAPPEAGGLYYHSLPKPIRLLGNPLRTARLLYDWNSYPRRSGDASTRHNDLRWRDNSKCGDGFVWQCNNCRPADKRFPDAVPG